MSAFLNCWAFVRFWMCAWRVFHATDALKKKEVVCLVVRAAGRISCLGFLWDRGLREEAKGGRQFVSGSCWRLRKRWSRHKLAISRSQPSDGQSRAWSSSLLGVHHGAWRLQRATAVWMLSSWRASSSRMEPCQQRGLAYSIVGRT